MSRAKVDRYCRACNKIFCCIECRKRHEAKKHPDRQLNCPFCSSQKLLLRTIEDRLLLGHIAINHLPLHCCLCGEVFKQIQDLESFGVCKWYAYQRRHSLVPYGKPLLGTPPSENDKQCESSIVNEYRNNFDVTSPPELYRNTSTPMVIGQKGNLDFKTPNVPNFSLKTPKTNSAASLKGQLRGSSQVSQVSQSKDSNSDSDFVSFSPATFSLKDTPFRSAPPPTRPTEEECPSRNNSGRILNIMKEHHKRDSIDSIIGDNYHVEDMELTGIESVALPDSQGLELIPAKPERQSDSIKKVRFSDQYTVGNELDPSTTSVSGTMENEEYFEAHETMSGMDKSMENYEKKINEDNAKNAEKENQSPETRTAINNQQSSGSSRIIMMLVVENNATNSLSTSDLAPLIDTGLKKLQDVTSKCNNSSAQSISDINSPTCSTNSLTSVDSYYSATSYERYTSATSSINSPTGSNLQDSNSSTDSTGSTGSGGILSAVANVVRTVMRNFSGAGTSRMVTHEQISHREEVVTGLRPSPGETQQNSLSNLTSPALQRPGKRPRDTESVVPPPVSVSALLPQIEPRSPLAKRHRGWYRIKAREPIARMRNAQIRSPRGVSSETQVFSQGSLSVGDTVLPLPARAHQSTQTDN